jgi:hypothetical protein
VVFFVPYRPAGRPGTSTAHRIAIARCRR